MPLFQFALLSIVGLLGLFTHWFNDWVKGRVRQSFSEYMLGAYGHSLGSLGALFTLVATQVATGHGDILDPMVFITAFTAGYSLDSLINKSSENQP
jgi:hypothetical protein